MKNELSSYELKHVSISTRNLNSNGPFENKEKNQFSISRC